MKHVHLVGSLNKRVIEFPLLGIIDKIDHIVFCRKTRVTNLQNLYDMLLTRPSTPYSGRDFWCVDTFKELMTDWSGDFESENFVGRPPPDGLTIW